MFGVRGRGAGMREARGGETTQTLIAPGASNLQYTWPI